MNPRPGFTTISLSECPNVEVGHVVMKPRRRYKPRRVRESPHNWPETFRSMKLWKKWGDGPSCDWLVEDGQVVGIACSEPRKENP